MAYDLRGEGVGKPIIFVAASREGLARARDVPNDQWLTLEPALPEWIKRETTSLMTGGKGEAVISQVRRALEASAIISVASISSVSSMFRGARECPVAVGGVKKSDESRPIVKKIDKR